jgi:hypothetical protein
VSPLQSVRAQEIYDEDSAIALEVPPRSQLYALKGEGINTPLVESFTCYVMRCINGYGLKRVTFG